MTKLCLTSVIFSHYAQGSPFPHQAVKSFLGRDYISHLRFLSPSPVLGPSLFLQPPLTIYSYHSLICLTPHHFFLSFFFGGERGAFLMPPDPFCLSWRERVLAGCTAEPCLTLARTTTPCRRSAEHPERVRANS